MATRTKTIEGEIVKLDYADFRDTEFKNCKMIYAGGRPPTLVNNGFTNCEWISEGEAQNTVLFLKSMYDSGGGFEKLIKVTIFGPEK